MVIKMRFRNKILRIDRILGFLIAIIFLIVFAYLLIFKHPPKIPGQHSEEYYVPRDLVPGTEGTLTGAASFGEGVVLRGSGKLPRKRLQCIVLDGGSRGGNHAMVSPSERAATAERQTLPPEQGTAPDCQWSPPLFGERQRPDGNGFRGDPPQVDGACPPSVWWRGQAG
jgi:hypothetical protein